MSFGQWPRYYLGVPIGDRFNFNPLTYGIDGAWFDTEDMSTMFQDAAGTIPVTAMEQPVGLWLDKSGNGNHATQSITASRPTLSARYNLLTKTEDFGSAASWLFDYVGTAGGLITRQYGYANDGTQSVARLQMDLNGGTSANDRVQLYQSITTTKGVTYTYSMLVRSNTEYEYTIQLSSNGEVVSYHTVGMGWKLIQVSATASDSNRGIRIGLRGDTPTSNYADILVWHPQINIGANILPYQRVNTDTDYDSVGWPKYLKGDGVDDFYNLPFMNLYDNGACSIVAARDAVSQATDTYIISERSTTDADPKYFPSRQLASGGNMVSYIVSDEGTVRLDTTGSVFVGAKLAAIRSVVDSGNNIKLFKDGAIVADDNYTRAGALTLNNTTIGASVSTTTSNYANMRLYGLIITKSALSDTDRRRCEQFLASRLSTIGVTLS